MNDQQPLSSNQTQVHKANQRRDKFAHLLREMFQLNQPELDFGLYRIMHARKDDINRFIEQDLPRLTRDAFANFASSDKAELQKELDKAIQGAQALEMDPDTLPKVKQLKAQLSDGFDLAREEGEVYDALVTFFSRYYDEGDFISRRVYKDGTYAIPYQGEEVVLHWANKDQYYVKSSETLRDYSFRLNPHPSSAEPNPMRVHFKLVDAEAGAQNNNKESDSSKRVFVLDHTQPFELLEGEPDEQGNQHTELQIRFVFRAATQDDWQTNSAIRAEFGKATVAAKKKPPVQGVLVASAVNWLLSADSQLPEQWRKQLALPYTKADGEPADYSQLQGQLNNYTKKNSFDYFIHKDLGGFLTRELDFYIKNELLSWDDLAALKHNPARLAPLLSKVEVIRKLGENIIAFLAQLENFQKKLWLKKKFVTDIQYCLTLDRLSEHDTLLAQVFDNPAQQADWATLYGLDLAQLQKDLEQNGPAGLLPQARYRYLMLDTRHFSPEFKAQLLATMDDLDQQCDGLLVHSENFQALNLLQERYREQVKCIYIDPPYNTGGDGFAYKDTYQHSSWLSCLKDRVDMSSRLHSENSCLWISIDGREQPNLRKLMDIKSEKMDFIADIAVVNNWKGRQDKEHIATAHENVLLYAKENFESNGFPLSEDKISDYKLSDSNGLKYSLRDLRKRGGADTREERPNMFFPIYWSPSERTASITRKNIDDIEIYPKKSDNSDGCWRWGKDTVQKNIEIIECSKVDDVRWNCSYRIYLENDGKVRTSKPKSTWIGSRYSTDGGGKTLRNIIPNTDFSSPKSLYFLKDILIHSMDNDEVTLDFFAGSGTTGHAVIDLNREDNGQRKYLLVEMGDYFDTVLKPRIQKVVYADNWKAGAPVANEDGGFNGVSHCFKYIRLESYEDALGNLSLQRSMGQQSLLDSFDNEALDAARQSYVMNYLLEVETRGSASLLNTRLFTDPTAYQLNVRSAGGDETRAVKVDLLETFNYLLGLTVEHIAPPLWFDADLSQAELGRWQATVKHIDQAELNTMDENQRGRLWWFRTVYGVNRAGQKVLVVWRNLPSMLAQEDKGLLKDNAVLDAVLLEKLNIRLTASQDDEVDILYVNGDHNIAIPKNRRGEPMEEARVQMIEEAFHRLMFANTDGNAL
ncbi:site-specific DNA-methyltransferase [Oceanimonas sp. CHS3-5]|uniref:site-specific DNA-methyltransferase n=1 Tax=Oceanimonas sp. CHS3-5 TaxID=3068186 RepID=UPI00273DFA8F|nr:site-specific DNA-methyltransferase [Oceanimonas sp. CHS3-5]MDP5292453.1 site-specific DNA-methyltransferase [Oceanimonas sp. CHS3-5]